MQQQQRTYKNIQKLFKRYTKNIQKYKKLYEHKNNIQNYRHTFTDIQTHNNNKTHTKIYKHIQNIYTKDIQKYTAIYKN